MLVVESVISGVFDLTLSDSFDANISLAFLPPNPAPICLSDKDFWAFVNALPSTNCFTQLIAPLTAPPIDFAIPPTLIPMVLKLAPTCAPAVTIPPNAVNEVPRYLFNPAFIDSPATEKLSEITPPNEPALSILVFIFCNSATDTPNKSAVCFFWK